MMSQPSAVVGAEYYDETYDQKCTVVDVTNGDSVSVILEYEYLGRINISLERFESTSGLRLIDVPE